jgi:hypothetical protein
MLAMMWWGWGGIAAGGAGALVALWATARRSWRSSVRQEFLQHLRRTAPDLAITGIHPDRIEVALPDASPDASATLCLARLYQRVADLPASGTPEQRGGRPGVYDRLIATLRDGTSGLQPMDGAADRRNVMPRLISDDALAALRVRVAPAGQPTGRWLPSVPSGVAGLSIVFVLDGAAAVAYLTSDRLAELNLTPAEALAVGRANLARTFGRDVVRSAVRSTTINIVKVGDSFDATRLLLIPSYLEAGESLIAIVPDRDTLVLTPPPEDGDWTRLRTLAGAADGDPLCSEPLIVTPSGFDRAA